MGLWDAFDNNHMGVTAENVAAEFSISREMQDDTQLLSHIKAMDAQEKGIFAREIVPVEWQDRKGKTLRVDTDEGPAKPALKN